MMAAQDGDPSFFLPKNTSIVNTYRNAKGDMDGTVATVTVSDQKVQIITHAKVIDRSVCAALIEKGFLEDHHKSYGDAFLEMQNAFRSPLQHRLNAACLEDLVGSSVSGSEAAQMYDEIVKQISYKRAIIVEHACVTPAEDDAACKIIQGIDVYRECFSALVTAIDEARKKRKDARENALANDPRFR